MQATDVPGRHDGHQGCYGESTLVRLIGDRIGACYDRQVGSIAWYVNFHIKLGN